MRTNADKLIKQAVQGEPIHPYDNVITTNEGRPMTIPVCEAITFGLRVGDSAYGWIADHVEPSVTINNSDSDEQSALVRLACAGNEAIVVSGKAEGARGTVTGKHGGGWNVIIDFPEEAMEKMAYGDKVLVKSFGQGLKLLDYPEVDVMSIDPDLLQRLDIREEDGKLKVPVTAEIPSFIMGSGVGADQPMAGDIDMMTSDDEITSEYGLDKLNLGDFVLLKDMESLYYHARVEGAVSIGIVIHGDSYIGSHGPGIMPILSCGKGDLIEGIIDESANIVKYL